MRSLFVAILLLALALPGFAFNICPYGNLTDEYVYTDVPGESYTATSCTFNGGVYLYSQNAPINTSAIWVTVANSKVNGLLQFRGFSSSRAASVAPLYVTIRDNTFNSDAVLYIYRYLPANSTLTIQNNKMSGNGTTTWLEGYYLVYFGTMYLYGNTTINIIDNTMTYNSPESSVYPLYIGSIYNQASQRTGTINILRNTITVNGSYDGSLIYFEQWEMEQNSSLKIESNKLTITKGQYAVSALYLSYVSGDISCQLSVSSNEVSVSSTNTGGYVFNLNDIEYTNLYVENNAITANYQNFIFSRYFYYLPYARIKGNTLRSTSASITSPPIYVDYYYVADNSTLVIANNEVTASSVTSTDILFLEVYDVAIQGPAAIVHCGNSVPWVNATTPVSELFPSALAELLVYDAEACKGSSTRAPSASALVGTCLAAAVCLVAAIAALL